MLILLYFTVEIRYSTLNRFCEVVYRAKAYTGFLSVSLTAVKKYIKIRTFS